MFDFFAKKNEEVESAPVSREKLEIEQFKEKKDSLVYIANSIRPTKRIW